MTLDPTERSVSVVIPAKNEAENIGPCITSIHAAGGGLLAEVILVDNGSTDATREIAESLGATVLIRPQATISELRNSGAQAASGSIVAFVDADVLVGSGWLTNAVSVLQRPGVVCAGCSPTLPAEATWVQRAWHFDLQAAPETADRDWLASMNLLVARETFEKTGGFDPALQTCEDVDFGYRLRRHGRIVADKSIAAVHLGEAATLREFFRKECWRGLGNVRGMLRHGLVKEELPSHLVALCYFALYLALPLSLLLGEYRLLAALVALSLLPPVGKIARLDGILGNFKTLCQVYLVWLVYCWARGGAVWRWLWQAFKGGDGRLRGVGRRSG